MQKIRIKTIRTKAFSLRLVIVFSILIFNSNSSIFSEEHLATIKSGIKINQSHLILLKLQRFGFSVFVPYAYVYASKRAKKVPNHSLLKISTNIMGKGLFSAALLADFLKKNNPKLHDKKVREIASLYVKEAQIEGVNPDVAFIQMCLETGFLKFGGNVLPSQNNFCGLGVTGIGQKGLSFPSLQLGIRAHIQHLKAYASTEKLHQKLIDSRFRFVKRGSIGDIKEMGGKWASDRYYGQKIESLLKRLYRK